MAEGGEDQEQKTEHPTQKRIEEALKRGQVPFSREIGSFLMLFALTITVAWVLPGIGRDSANFLVSFLAHTEDYPTDRASVGRLMMSLGFHLMGLLTVPLVLAVAATFGASIGQNGFLLSAEPIMPKWEKISPLQGIKRIFSMRSLVEFLKGLAKLTVVGTVAYLAVEGEMRNIRQLPDRDMAGLLALLAQLAIKLLVWVCVAMFFIAVFDFMYQRFAFYKSLRMSRQEIKDEYRQQEGDPQVKRRLRQIRMERARKRMMAAVPKADVIITNPTHFAVALIYEQGKMKAPTVVAKGMDHMALQMRKIAEQYKIAIVENPPLARALYDSVKVDEEIPLQHYKAVAEIISYVWRLKGKLPTLNTRPQGRR